MPRGTRPRCRAPPRCRRTRRCRHRPRTRWSLPVTTTAFTAASAASARAASRMAPSIACESGFIGGRLSRSSATPSSERVISTYSSGMDPTLSTCLRRARKSTSAATGSNPPPSTARSDAALPGATCAHSGTPSGTRPRAAATSRRPSPWPRASGAISKPISHRPQMPRPIARIAVTVTVRHTSMSSRYRRARVDARMLGVDVGLQPVGRAGAGAERAQQRVERQRPAPDPIADPREERGRHRYREVPGGNAFVTSDGTDVGREHEVAGEADHRVGGSGQPRQHLEPAVSRREVATRGGVAGSRRAGARRQPSTARAAHPRLRTGRGRRRPPRRATPRTRAACTSRRVDEQLLGDDRADLGARVARAGASRPRRSLGDARDARPIASQRSSMPSPVVAMVQTIGGRQSRLPASSSMPSRSRTVSGAPGRSALLTTNTSAISSSPAFAACTASPHPGFTTTTVVSACPAISTSTCPTPTVSITIHGLPDRVEHAHRLRRRDRRARRGARASPSTG